jgi:N-carbamoyl-L-amino-acid hydrolase
MQNALAPDIALATTLFAALREATHDGVGITREAYGRGERIAHGIVRAAAQRMGLEIVVDPAGNLLMTLPGRDRAAPAVVIGSHLDSVRQGGNYDGAAGVLAGLAAVAGMRAGGFGPARDVIVAAIRAEEGGSWFPAGLPGSRAALGRLPPAALAVRRLDSGRTLAEHMREEGLDPDAVAAGECTLPPARVAAFVELHIEQGPLLEHAGFPLGIVTAIPGARRLRAARVFGEYNHSGATPRRWRADAALALAELAVRLDERWAELDAEGRSVFCTFCVLRTTEEAGFTKVPGEAYFELDVRSIEPAHVDAIFATLHRLVPEIEARRGVRFELGEEAVAETVPLDPAMQRALARAAEARGVAYRIMPSGGTHDVASFAEAGVPAGMLFVRNQHGSHGPREDMRMDDFAAATSVLLHWAVEAAG